MSDNVSYGGVGVDFYGSDNRFRNLGGHKVVTGSPRFAKPWLLNSLLEKPGGLIGIGRKPPRQSWILFW